jgi:hypothetical protein
LKIKSFFKYHRGGDTAVAIFFIARRGSFFYSSSRRGDGATAFFGFGHSAAAADSQPR